MNSNFRFHILEFNFKTSVWSNALHHLLEKRDVRVVFLKNAVKPKKCVQMQLTIKCECVHIKLNVMLIAS